MEGELDLSQREEISIRGLTDQPTSELLISGFPVSFPISLSLSGLRNSRLDYDYKVTHNDCQDCQIQCGLKLGITKDELEKNSPANYHGLFSIRHAKQFIKTGKPGSYFLASENGENHLSLLIIKADGKPLYYNPLGDCPRDLQSVAGLEVSLEKWQRGDNKTCGFHCHFVRGLSQAISSVTEIKECYRVLKNGDPDVFVIKEFKKKRRKELSEGKSVEFQFQPFIDSDGVEITEYRTL